MVLRSRIFAKAGEIAAVPKKKKLQYFWLQVKKNNPQLLEIIWT